MRNRFLTFKRGILKASIAALTLACLAGCASRTSQPTSSRSSSSEPFVPLFNGRDLSGWVPVNVAPGTFTVRDGMIVSTGVPTGVMRTTKHYENFILEVDWKHIKQGGNAGVFLYSEPVTAAGTPFAKGLEVQVIDGDSPEGIWTGHGDLFPIHGATAVPDRPHPRGWMRCLPSEKRAHPFGEWNHYRIESRDGRVTLAVNGKVVSGVSNCIPRRGYLCLESEGSECHFKNLRIHELPSSNPPAKETSGLNQGFQSLYTGLDLGGWRAEEGHANHWRAKNWTLDCDGAGKSILWSTGEWGDFEMICDWKLTDNNSKAGIYVRGRPEGIGRRGYLVPLGEAGKWHRAVITVRGTKAEVKVDGHAIETGSSLERLPASGPIGLMHDGKAVQFANIFVRKLDAP